MRKIDLFTASRVRVCVKELCRAFAVCVCAKTVSCLRSAVFATSVEAVSTAGKKHNLQNSCSLVVAIVLYVRKD